MGVPRFESDDITAIQTGARIGAVNRQVRETDDERRSRLSAPNSEHEQAIAEILTEVEEQKETAGLADNSRLNPEYAEDFVTGAVLASAYASDRVVADNASARQSIEQQHWQHFQDAFNGDIGDDQPSDFERAALEAEIAAPEGTDPVVGVDELGRDVYRDEDGTDYVLTDAA
jgi:hypothetical protein